MTLDSRQVRIVRWLLEHRDPASTASLATALGLSQRIVRYRLGGVRQHLNSLGLDLAQRPGVGIWIDGDEVDIQRLSELLNAQSDAPRVLAVAERSQILRAVLLSNAPDAVPLDTLHQVTEVSATTGRRDLREIEPWMSAQGLVLARTAGRGVSVIGAEAAVRRSIMKLILEAVPSDAMREVTEVGVDSASLAQTRISSGLREILRSLQIDKSARIVSQGQQPVPGVAGSELLLSLYLSIALTRMAGGNYVEMDAGQLRSLLDHPVSDAARGFATQLAAAQEAEFPDVEIAGVTSMLLGFAGPVETARGNVSDAEGLAMRVLTLAARELHPILTDDVELKRSLLMHLDRLRVRLSYGVPVHNPLLGEVRDRYPAVHAVSCQIGAILEQELGESLPEDELGFITMYLSGAMERTQLWPRRRAVLVCPSGMATVWILVSRIQSEFPQLELAEVISAVGYDASTVTADIVISTVELPGIDAVVVNPLLPADDVRAISLRLGQGS